MVSFLITALIVIIAGVLFALGARIDPGYVLLKYHGWTVESSAVVFLVAALIAFAVLYLLVRFLIKTVHMPRRLRQWRRLRRQARGRGFLMNGLMALAEGHWEQAEDLLLKHIGDSDAPSLNYIAAAKAAQKQGSYERCEDYLTRAHRAEPRSELAIGLLQAELQLAWNQADQAVSTLANLHYLAPKHPYVLKLMVQLYYVLQDWERVLTLLPELRKRSPGDFEELEKIEHNAYIELLATNARNKDLYQLQHTWHRVPRDLKGHEALLQEYVRDLVVCGANTDAEVLVYQTLRKRWYQPLVYLYGLVEGDAAVQLSRAESWLNEHREDPTLLLTLGRIALRANLWGKARSYLEASLAFAPKPETYKELGDLLQQLGEKEAALECYRQGLSRAAAAPPAKPPARPPRVITAEIPGEQRLLSTQQ